MTDMTDPGRTNTETPGGERFRFHVTGVEEQQTALPTHLRAFDETYEIAGEHPAEALEKLLDEIEWGILDATYDFTISFIAETDGRVSS
jgi:hypothetical protein